MTLIDMATHLAGPRKGPFPAFSRESLRQFRERYSLSQEDVAHAIGVSVSTLNRWENLHQRPLRLYATALRDFMARVVADEADGRAA